ncbi:hypothetical protein PCE1_003805 [Barthelona sp. PCE]
MVFSLFPCPGPPQEALSTYSSREFLLQMHDAGILLFYSRFQPWQDTTSSFVRVFYPMGPPAGMRHLYNHAISLYNFQSISSRFAAIFSMIPSSNMKIASPVILFDHKRDYLQNMDQEGFRPDGIHGTRVEGSPEPVQTTGNAENGVSFEKKKDSCCDGSAAISNSEDVVLVSLRSLNTKKWAQIVNMKKTFLVVMQNDSKGVRPSRSACIGA